MDRRGFLQQAGMSAATPSILTMLFPITAIRHLTPDVEPNDRPTIKSHIQAQLQTADCEGTLVNGEGYWIAWRDGAALDDFDYLGDVIDCQSLLIYPKAHISEWKTIHGPANATHTSKKLDKNFWDVVHKGGAWGNEVILRVKGLPYVVKWFAYTREARLTSDFLRAKVQGQLRATDSWDDVGAGWDSIVKTFPNKRRDL